MGCLTPISLLTDITDTREVSGRMEASNSWTHTQTHAVLTGTPTFVCHPHKLNTFQCVWWDLSVCSAGVPRGPAVRSSLLVGRWRWILQPPEFGTSPKRTYVPSVWWSHGASWPCRTCRHPAGEGETLGFRGFIVLSDYKLQRLAVMRNTFMVQILYVLWINWT